MKRLAAVLTGFALVALLTVVAWYNSPRMRESRALQPSRLAGGSERDNRNIGEVDLEKLYPDIILRMGKGTAKRVALTFDDGPDRTYTPVVLDILRDKGIKATFFLIGKRVQENPRTAKRIADEGHLIGNHGYSHAQLKAAGPGVEQELSQMESALKGSYGVQKRSMASLFSTHPSIPDRVNRLRAMAQERGQY